jgi:hypothetical protein
MARYDIEANSWVPSRSDEMALAVARQGAEDDPTKYQDLVPQALKQLPIYQTTLNELSKKKDEMDMEKYKNKLIDLTRKANAPYPQEDKYGGQTYQDISTEIKTTPIPQNIKPGGSLEKMRSNLEAFAANRRIGSLGDSLFTSMASKPDAPIDSTAPVKKPLTQSQAKGYAGAQGLPPELVKEHPVWGVFEQDEPKRNIMEEIMRKGQISSDLQDKKNAGSMAVANVAKDKALIVANIYNETAKRLGADKNLMNNLEFRKKLSDKVADDLMYNMKNITDKIKMTPQDSLQLEKYTNQLDSLNNELNELGNTATSSGSGTIGHLISDPNKIKTKTSIKKPMYVIIQGKKRRTSDIESLLKAKNKTQTEIDDYIYKYGTD